MNIYALPSIFTFHSEIAPRFRSNFLRRCSWILILSDNPMRLRTVSLSGRFLSFSANDDKLSKGRRTKLDASQTRRIGSLQKDSK